MEKHAVRGPGGQFVKVGEPPKPRIVIKRPPQKTGQGMGPLRPAGPLNVKRSKHLIDDISFSQDFIVCTCAWKGEIDAYQPHRREAEPSAPKEKAS